MSEDFNIPSNADENQSLFKGPANWFTLKIPQNVRLEQTEAFLEVRPNAVAAPAGIEANVEPTPWTMTLYAAWVDDGEPETKAASFDPTSLFPRVDSCQSVTPLTIAGHNQTWAGISTKPKSGPWWNAFLRRRTSYAWRLWVVEYKDIIVVASLQTKNSVPLEKPDVEVCEQLLNSIEFTETLAKPPELFRSDVISLAQKHFPLLTSTASGNFSVKIGESDINLANFYRSYIHSPEQLKQIVLPGLATVVRLQEWGPEQLMPPFEEVADRIMPMLYPEADADDSLKDFVKVPWVGGLTVMFVLDEDSTYRFVHRKMLDMWEVSVDELQELAMTNLETFASENPLEVTLIGNNENARMLVPVEPNAYNSVRLLGGDLHHRLRQLLGAELVVGIPNRDFFVAVSLKHPQLIGQVRQCVIEDYQSMHHPLTSRLLVISADGVSEYCEQ